MPRPTIALTLALATLAATPQAQAGDAKSVRSVCRADYERLCHDVQPGGGRIKACMKEHLSQLSEDCRNAPAHKTKQTP